MMNDQEFFRRKLATIQAKKREIEGHLYRLRRITPPVPDKIEAAKKAIHHLNQQEEKAKKHFRKAQLIQFRFPS